MMEDEREREKDEQEIILNLAAKILGFGEVPF